MIRKVLGLCGFSVVTAAAAMMVAQSAAGPKTVWDKVYSDAQQKRGAELYKAQNCGLCHGDDLAGKGQVPGLATDAFLEKWNGQPLDSVFEKMQNTMPAIKPGSLSRQQNADIMAYILNQLGAAAGANELSGDKDALMQVKVTKDAPK